MCNDYNMRELIPLSIWTMRGARMAPRRAMLLHSDRAELLHNKEVLLLYDGTRKNNAHFTPDKCPPHLNPSLKFL